MPVSKNRRKKPKRRKAPEQRPMKSKLTDSEVILYQDDDRIVMCSDNLFDDEEGEDCDNE